MRNKSHKILAGVLLVAGILLLAGCPPRESIERIKVDPGKFAGREVTIAGRVTNAYGVMGKGGFELDDGTGRMWVFTSRYGVPGMDAKVAVTGLIEESVTLGGRHWALIMRETRRRG
ncbi:MAG: hypothetical protein JOY93_11995 [Acidobacteriales bacterium]|nr:hypothetical protein [Terriglobales bacterium]